MLDLLTKGWSGFVAGHGLPMLQTALAAWLPRQRWFGAKTRKIQSVRVIDWAELPAAIAANTIVPPSNELPTANSIPPALFYFQGFVGSDASRHLKHAIEAGLVRGRLRISDS